jgi:uncharacterized protein YggE
MTKLRFAALALVASCVLAGPALAQEKIPALVTVTGEGQVNVTPDLAVIRAGITTRAKAAREASEANAKAMTPVMATLKEAGIAEQDIQTSRLSLQPFREARPNELDRLAGFQASNQLTIKVRDLNKISDIIDRMVSAGANDVSGVNFVVSTPSKALDQAREQAVADARRKAEIYARAANVRLGAAVSIAEEGSAAPGPIMAQRMSAAAATPISIGEETQRVSVTVSFELLR